MDSLRRTRTATAEDLEELIDKLRAFVRLTNKYRRIERDIKVPAPLSFADSDQDNHAENDLEHTGQLVFLSWFLIQYLERKGFIRPQLLDELALFKGALCHDLTELINGDEPLRANGSREAKQLRDRQAVGYLAMAWRYSFPGMIQTLEEYEGTSPSLESRFVRALDKLIGVLNVWEDGGTSWREQRWTFESYRDEIMKRIREAIGSTKELPILIDLSEAIFVKLSSDPGLFWQEA